MCQVVLFCIKWCHSVSSGVIPQYKYMYIYIHVFEVSAAHIATLHSVHYILFY